MGLYNFQARFVPFILSGKKKHTIRSRRAHPDKPGNTLHLYSGLRTKKAQLLMRATCTRVEEIVITEIAEISTPGFIRVVLAGHELDLSECRQLAIRDGFKSFTEMVAFWRQHRALPFRGHVIHWSKPFEFGLRVQQRSLLLRG